MHPRGPGQRGDFAGPAGWVCAGGACRAARGRRGTLPGRGGRRGPGDSCASGGGGFPGARAAHTALCFRAAETAAFPGQRGPFSGGRAFSRAAPPGRTWGLSGPHGGALPGRRACRGRGRRRGKGVPGAAGRGRRGGRTLLFPGGVCRVSRDSVALGGSVRRKSLPAQYKEARRTTGAFLSNQSYSGPITLCFSSGCFFGGAE